MHLPVEPPIAPMLAKPASTIPAGMHYEGKWDGFRAIVFRAGDEIVIGSRNEKPLTRYFPELVEALRENLPERCVVDGEIIIATRGHLDFDALLNRIHPADSRVKLLAQETPASFVAFDLLALGDDDLMQRPFSDRRASLERVLATANPAGPVHLAPGTTNIDQAKRWFVDFEGAGLDGLIAKPLNGLYESNKRTMIKIKHERTADCVVAGFRWHKSGQVVGSLLLGLYDEQGGLHQVGVSASFTAAKRAELVEILKPLRLDDNQAGEHPWVKAISGEPGAEGENVRLPGGQSRWNAGKDLSWMPLDLALVVEVAYDHMSGTRFRHTASFRRWRPDRDPLSCTYAQLEHPVTMELAEVLFPGPFNQ